MYWIPILGALALASATVWEKSVLKKKIMGIQLYQGALFLAVVLVAAPLMLFFWKLEPGAWELKNILIFCLIIVFSLFANILGLYAIKSEKVGNLQPAKVMEPLFVILIALAFSFIFDGVFERDIKVLIPALIAGSVLIFSHIEKSHLKMNKYFISAIFGSLFYALELVLSKFILSYYSPLSFYFLRCLAIFLVSLIIFRPKLSTLDGKLKLHILGIGALWVLYRGAIYYGYTSLGITSTTLVIMLGPIFVYVFANKFLKEKIPWRKVVASGIIIACVIYALFA